MKDWREKRQIQRFGPSRCLSSVSSVYVGVLKNVDAVGWVTDKKRDRLLAQELIHPFTWLQFYIGGLESKSRTCCQCQFAANVYPGRSSWCLLCLYPGHLFGRPGLSAGLLAVAWPSPSYCITAVKQQVDHLSPVLFLSTSSFQIKKMQKYTFLETKILC